MLKFGKKKKAEEYANKLYPLYPDCKKEPYLHANIDQLLKQGAVVKGYDKGESDMLETTCDWIRKNVDNYNTGEYKSPIDVEKFIEDLKKTLKKCLSSGKRKGNDIPVG